MMRTLILISSLALAACNMAADAQQPAGGGERGQRSYNLTGFDKVALAGPHDVVVTVGPAHSVEPRVTATRSTSSTSGSRMAASRSA
jgi:hypothetical protein